MVTSLAAQRPTTTTQSAVDFHNCRAVLFSHPKEFTAACITELGFMARIEPEFTKRYTKLIDLSIDPVDRLKSGCRTSKKPRTTNPSPE